MSDTFTIPLTESRDPSDPEAVTVGHLEVPAWSVDVPGLIITAATDRWLAPDSYLDGVWVVTHKGTGKSLGGYKYESVAAAKRAARRVADVLDWTDTDEIRRLHKSGWPDDILETLRAAMLPESHLDIIVIEA